MPVRKIPKNYRNVTGVASHHKATGRAMFESTLERDFLTLLEFDPAVESFEVQPVTVHWLDESDKERIYTPDVLAYFHSTHHPTTLYEVKYRSELKELWPELKPKFRAALQFARAGVVQGIGFDLRTTFSQDRACICQVGCLPTRFISNIQIAFCV